VRRAGSCRCWPGFFVEGEEVQHALGIQLAVALQVAVQGAAAEQRHRQFVQAIAAPGLGHQ